MLSDKFVQLSAYMDKTEVMQISKFEYCIFKDNVHQKQNILSLNISGERQVDILLPLLEAVYSLNRRASNPLVTVHCLSGLSRYLPLDMTQTLRLLKKKKK